jgi:3-oxoacyl-[acyl-carrier protein] reductase
MTKVWVTGSSGGLGTAISTKLESQGHDVIRLTRANFDLSSPESVELWLSGQEANFPDILICNAAVNVPKDLELLSVEEITNSLQINFLSHLRICQRILPTMLSNKSGHILFVSSLYSYKARKGRAAYSISKAAQDAYMRNLALETAGHGLIVNSVSPGFIDTELTRRNNDKEAILQLVQNIPMERLAQPEEIAELVAFLVSTKNSYITGQNINIDGGFSLR